MSGDPTGALIDQTMLCEAARFLETQRSADESTPLFRGRTTNAERLFHLASMLDALVLYDELYVLPATLPPDAETLVFRSHFVRNGTIKLLDTGHLAPYISEEFRQFFADLEPAREDLKGISENLTREIVYVADASLRNVPPNGSTESDGSGARSSENALYSLFAEDAEGDLAHWWLQERSAELERNAIATLGSHLMDEIGYFGSGAVIDGVSHLRTFYYWRVSDRTGMPFLPSCRRAPQYEAIARQLRRAAEQQVYKVVADAFRSTVEEVHQDSATTTVQLPPFLSLFLDKARSTSDFCGIVKDLRGEFEGLRRAFKALQVSLAGSSTIGERLEAKRKIKALLASLRGHYQAQQSVILDEVIGYAPEVLKPLTHPLDPTKYSAALVGKPLQWIREWWCHRPFRLAYRLRDRLHAIASYDTLVDQALGIKMTAAESAAFQAHYDRYLSLYSCL